MWDTGSKDLTFAMVLAIVDSATKDGMLPPGVLDVAMRHSTLPLSSSCRSSILT